MRRFLAACLLLLALWSPAFAALSIEGLASTHLNNQCPTSATVQLSVTTVSANDILVIIAGADNTNAGGAAPNVSAVSTTGQATLTLTNRSVFTVHSGGTGTPFLDIEVWWVLAASAGTYAIVTTSSNVDNCALIGFGVAGANTTTPWDTNGSLAASASGAASAPSISGVSTSCDKTMLLMAAVGSDPNSGLADQVAAGAFTLMTNENASTGTNFSKTAAQQDIVAATQSGITTAFGTSWTGWLASVDAIRDATASCGGVANSGGVPLLMLGVGP